MGVARPPPLAFLRRRVTVSLPDAHGPAGQKETALRAPPGLRATRGKGAAILSGPSGWRMGRNMWPKGARIEDRYTGRHAPRYLPFASSALLLPWKTLTTKIGSPIRRWADHPGSYGEAVRDGRQCRLRQEGGKGRYCAAAASSGGALAPLRLRGLRTARCRR